MLCMPMFRHMAGELSYQGVLPEKLSGGVQPASKNPYSIKD